MQITNGLILQHIVDADKQIPCVFQERTAVVPLADMLVWWKREFHWIKTNELGDGMQGINVLERPFMLVKLDPQWVIMGMSLYQEFDEEVGFMKTYCYKFPKDDATLHHVQDIVHKQCSGYTLVRDGKFVQLRGEQISYPVDEHAFSIELMHAGTTAALSFLWGMCLAYGDVQFTAMPDSLHMTIPLVGSIASREVYIQAVVRQLQSHGMYVSMQVQDQSFGQALQIRITDREIITIFAAWLGIDHTQVVRKKTYESMKGNLVQRLEKQTVDKAFLDRVEYAVVKLLRK